ncbi:heparan-alpha-glucosaminide N-acetyltransferase domain-containing protein [Candidatus Laterigemmans baculatus]|uniref:heparan-alpha-glucosaminide N-acetyltransferase domain-containing protein n=1 Tax=Candidatus Laterigemmans baculatus TaxID=2770505 RepID=UPI00193C0AB4|nr:heparan-alpha-glucosaminide N-acetyltransferase domain-containing protein [Candidatus Laterigemmans baculatus]
MDQFRGFAVTGMFVVNFLGGLAVTHQVLKHNNTHFSWADSIMPGFLFACGFSYRLSILRKIPELGRRATWLGVVRRSLGLVLLSLVLYGAGNSFDSWQSIDALAVQSFAAQMLKADLWEVLAIIGVVQLLLLPVIEASPRLRLAIAVGLSLGHVALSGWFNYWFVYGQANALDTFLGTTGRRAWDGGFFGTISWSVVMLAGTLTYDLMSARTARHAASTLVLWSLVLMGVGYAASCLTRLYDVREENPFPITGKTDSPFAQSPVSPPWANAAGRPWSSLLSEPPFVEPPGTAERKLNYWMMDKRVVTQSFVWFSTGFTCLTYAVFVVLCDLASMRVRLFTLFGQNALIAYAVHHPVAELVLQVVPEDSPVWWATIGLIVFFLITWFCVVAVVKMLARPAASNSSNPQPPSRAALSY